MRLSQFQRVMNGKSDKPFKAPERLPEGWVCTDTPVEDAVKEFPQLEPILRGMLESGVAEIFTVDVLNVDVSVGQSIGSQDWYLLKNPRDYGEGKPAPVIYFCQFGVALLESLVQPVSVKPQKTCRGYLKQLQKAEGKLATSIHPEGFFMMAPETAPFRHTVAQAPGNNITIVAKRKQK